MIFETLDTDKQEKIQAYLELVIEKNKELNLTRIDTKEKGNASSYRGFPFLS